MSHGFLANLGKSSLVNLVYSLRLLFDYTVLLAECLHDISRWVTCHRCHGETLLESHGALAAESLAQTCPAGAMSSCGGFCTTSLLPFGAPPPSQASFPRTTTVLSPVPGITQLYINSEQFGGGGVAAAQILQFPPPSAGDYHRWQPATPFSKFLGTQLPPTKF